MDTLMVEAETTRVFSRMAAMGVPVVKSTQYSAVLAGNASMTAFSREARSFMVMPPM